MDEEAFANYFLITLKPEYKLLRRYDSRGNVERIELVRDPGRKYRLEYRMILAEDRGAENNSRLFRLLSNLSVQIPLEAIQAINTDFPADDKKHIGCRSFDELDPSEKKRYIMSGGLL